MSKDILRQYGPDSPSNQRARASCGGVLPGDERDVMNYKPPQGPKGITDPKSPGLHGNNSGVANQPRGADNGRAGPGLGGTNHGCCGSQGRY